MAASGSKLNRVVQMFACPKKNYFPTPPAGLEGFVGQMRSIIPPVGFRVYARIVSMLDVHGNMWKRAARRHSDQMGPATLKLAVFNLKHSFSSFQQSLPISEKKCVRFKFCRKRERGAESNILEAQSHRWQFQCLSFSKISIRNLRQSNFKNEKTCWIIWKSQLLSEQSTVNIELLL